MHFLANFSYKCFINPKRGIVELKEENKSFPAFTEGIEKVTSPSVAFSLMEAELCLTRSRSTQGSPRGTEPC